MTNIEIANVLMSITSTDIDKTCESYLIVNNPNAAEEISEMLLQANMGGVITGPYLQATNGYPRRVWYVSKTAPVKAVAWKLGFGKDCDGHNSGRVFAYSTMEEAHAAAKESNEASDGIQYIATQDIQKLKEYCAGYDKDYTKYLNA